MCKAIRYITLNLVLSRPFFYCRKYGSIVIIKLPFYYFLQNLSFVLLNILYNPIISRAGEDS